MESKKLSLEGTLTEGQNYLSRFSKYWAVPVEVVFHEKATNTCYEKAELLGWKPEKVIKMIFAYAEGSMYGFVLPELGQKIQMKVLATKVLGYTDKQAKKFKTNLCPASMEYGTCTPFVSTDDFEEQFFGPTLKAIYVHDIPSLNEEIVDVSIGGDNEVAHKTSVQLPYSKIHDILKAQFGDRIKKVDLYRCKNKKNYRSS